MDWYNRDSENYFEGKHEHHCPECGRQHFCVLVACRVDKPVQSCWPCLLKDAK